jgi:predicted TPR repeat methyltransferase
LELLIKVVDIYKDGSYSQNNPDWHGADAGWKANKIAKVLKTSSIAFETCIEVGCGTGLVLEHLAQHFPGKSYSGYDISRDAAVFWKDRSKDIAFYSSNLLETQHTADVILLIDVFEHVPDYMGFLKALREHAEHFVFHVPLDMHVSGLLRDRQIHARSKVGHLHYFSQATALATLRDCGYELISASLTHLSQETVEGVSRRTRVANVLRRSIQAISPGLAAKLLGGYSLLVVCKTVKQSDR